MMEVILLERIEKLGQMGDVVTVKPGYARNFLLPQKKALRATAENKATFETERAQLEAQNLDRRGEAEAVAKSLAGLHLTMVRQAGESGQLYGSVSSRSIAEDITAAGFTIERRQVRLENPIKAIGLHPTSIALHPEVTVSVTINVARSEEEARIQEQTGEAVSTDDDQAPAEEIADAATAAEELLEETAVEALHEREAAETAADEREQAVEEARKAGHEAARKAARKTGAEARDDADGDGEAETDSSGAEETSAEDKE